MPRMTLEWATSGLGILRTQLDVSSYTVDSRSRHYVVQTLWEDSMDYLGLIYVRKVSC